MSDLQPIGVRFVAEGADQFYSQVQRGDDAVAKFGDSAQSSSGGLSGWGAAVAGAGTAVLNFAAGAVAKGVQALQQFGEESIDAATKYDDTMHQIAALTSTSADEIEGLKNQVLALSGQVGIGPQELADGLYFVASSGFAGRDAMEVLTASAKAAAAGLGETKTIADLTTSVLNAYGLGAEKATWATDILVQAVKEGKAEPAEFAGALGAVLPIAAAAGVSFEEVAASIASMTRVGLNANESVTALRGLIGGLEKPSVGAAKALQSIGLSADDVRASIREKGLLATLQDLMSRTNGNVEVLGKIIPNIRALTGALATAGSQADSYKQSLAAMQNAAGSTDKAFRTMSESAAFQQRAFTAAFDALKVEVGEKLLPLIGQAAGMGTQLAQSLMGKVGPALDDISQIVSTVSSALRVGFVPAVTGATAALVAYAIVQASQALPAILEMLPALALQTEAFFANAAAVAAAAAPYVLIAAAVAGVVYAYNDFNSKVQDATTQLLESRQWWNDSTAAIEDYSHSVGAARDALSPYAATITELRSEIQGEIEDLGRRSAAGLVTEAQYQQEMATINAQREGLIQVTKAYNDQEQALLHTAAASQTGTAQLQALVTGEQQVSEQTQLTEKELQALEKQIQKTFQEGSKAVESYVTTEVNFLSDLAAKQAEHTSKMQQLEKQLQDAKTAEQRQGIQERIAAEQKGYADQEAAAAASYAKQQAAQRAHIGQMLEDYTMEQVKLGNITGETADKILQQIEQQFGQVGDISARTFLQMTADIDKASKNGGAALDDLGKNLGDTTNLAVSTRQAMEALSKKYEAELIQNFNEGKISAQELTAELQKIPEKVYSEVTIVTKHVDVAAGTGRDEASTPPARAGGGPVAAGSTYMVGEQGPELFVPRSDGQIVDAATTRGLRGAGGAGGALSLDNMTVYAQQAVVHAPVVIFPLTSQSTTNQQSTQNYTLNMPTNQSPAAVQQGFYTMRALAGY